MDTTVIFPTALLVFIVSFFSFLFRSPFVNFSSQPPFGEYLYRSFFPFPSFFFFRLAPYPAQNKQSKKKGAPLYGHCSLVVFCFSLWFWLPFPHPSQPPSRKKPRVPFLFRTNLKCECVCQLARGCVYMGAEREREERHTSRRHLPVVPSQQRERGGDSVGGLKLKPLCVCVL